MSPSRAAVRLPLLFAALTGRPDQGNTAHGLARMSRIRAPIREASKNT